MGSPWGSSQGDAVCEAERSAFGPQIAFAQAGGSFQSPSKNSILDLRGGRPGGGTEWASARVCDACSVCGSRVSARYCTKIYQCTAVHDVVHVVVVVGCQCARQKSVHMCMSPIRARIREQTSGTPVERTFRFPRTARARRAAARPGGVVCRARGRRETPAITIGAHAALPGETFASINKGKCPTLNSRHMYTRSYSSTGPGRRVSRTRDPRSLGPHITPLTAAARAEAHSSLTTLVASAGPEAASGLSRRWSPRSILYGRRSSSRVSM